MVTGDRITAKALLGELPDLEVLDEVSARLEASSDGERAAATELALEGLYLARRIAKDPDEDGQTVYS